jgi:hypothetical protein
MAIALGDSDCTAVWMTEMSSIEPAAETGNPKPSVRDTPLGPQPSMDNLPLVSIPRLKIQKRGPGVLQFNKEL